MDTIYGYQNYRQFLGDYYRSQKARRTGFTYARFSEQAGMRSPNYLKLVMDGKKNLTAENIGRFARALRLRDAEIDCFEILVRLNQAKSSWEREYHEDRLRKLQVRVSLEKMAVSRTPEEHDAMTLSSWTHHALLLLTSVKDFRESPRWIRQKLFGLLSEDEIRGALQRLVDLRLLVRGRAGKLARSHRQIHVRPEFRKLSARIFSESLLERAGKALHLGEPESRELSTCLVGLSPEQLPELKRRVRDFMRTLSDWAAENPAPEQVFALAFCGFPLSAPDDQRPARM